ncbi:MAG: filamentous hemagglutinin, partial [Cyanobacteria bacterium J06638_38]
MVVSDGGQINSSTLGQGAAGNITITASDSVELLRSPEGIIIQTGIFPTSTIGEGKAGDLVLDTSRLIIQDGAGIASASGGIIGQTILSRNGGQTGNLTITTTESIEISGVSEPLADGNRIPSFISNQTSTKSDSGNITIDTNKLIVKDGGLISAATLDAGDAGNITINALESVEVSGAVLDGEFSSTIEASSGRAFSIEDANATGNAGNLFINTGNLLISDGGLMSASTFGEGIGGNINLNASESIEIVGTGFDDLEQNFVLGIISGTLDLSTPGTGLFTGSSGSASSGAINIETTSLRL